MPWFRTHPYALTLGVAGLLIIAGIFVVMTRSSAPPTTSQAVAWGGTGALLNPSYEPGTTSSQGPAVGIMQQVQSGAPYTYTLPVPQTTNPDTGETTGGFDFNAFIAMLSAETGAVTTGQPAGNAAVTNAYAFIPGGFIATTTVNKQTVLQKALYDYGNEAGSLIQSFEQQHTNESQVLTDQAQDRNDAGKAAAVQALGAQLSALGSSLLAMDSVPSQVADAHQALAQSYQNIGTKLALVPQAKSDADFIAAVQSYNSSADTFVKNYVALANLFVAYGVTFSQGDPGSVFTFAPTSGL